MEWGEFFIGGEDGLFIVKSTSSGIDKNKLNTDIGKIPYITRSEEVNGINLFISDKQDEKYKKDDGNVITIGLDTQTVFYQSNDFYTGQNIQILKNEKLNKYNALFIIPLLKIQMQKFNWGSNGATLTRLKRTKIVLPIDDGNPNWQFMEDYIKQEMKIQAKKVYDYYLPTYHNHLLQLGFEAVDLKVEWKEFKLKEIFNIKSVKGKTIKNYSTGTIPYVTTSSNNNGITNFIKTSQHLSLSNAISVDPIAGKSFYHNYDFIGRGGAGSAINLLYHEQLNEYSGKFICQVLEQVSVKKASYGVQLNGKRLKNLKILLPITHDGNPHWDYMEQFVRKITNNSLEKILEYIYIYIT